MKNAARMPGGVLLSDNIQESRYRSGIGAVRFKIAFSQLGRCADPQLFLLLADNGFQVHDFIAERLDTLVHGLKFLGQL